MHSKIPWTAALSWREKNFCHETFVPKMVSKCNTIVWLYGPKKEKCAHKYYTLTVMSCSYTSLMNMENVILRVYISNRNKIVGSVYSYVHNINIPVNFTVFVTEFVNDICCAFKFVFCLFFYCLEWKLLSKIFLCFSNYLLPPLIIAAVLCTCIIWNLWSLLSRMLADCSNQCGSKWVCWHVGIR
jgi:hypothetical protein